MDVDSSTLVTLSNGKAHCYTINQGLKLIDIWLIHHTSI